MPLWLCFSFNMVLYNIKPSSFWPRRVAPVWGIVVGVGSLRERDFRNNLKSKPKKSARVCVCGGGEQFPLLERVDNTVEKPIPRCSAVDAYSFNILFPTAYCFCRHHFNGTQRYFSYIHAGYDGKNISCVSTNLLLEERR